jgi:CRP-like cAMP-binding protein
MRDFLQRHVNLSEDDFARFIAKAKQRTFKSGEICFEPDEPFTRMYFITTGLVRCYRLTDGEDMTYAFYLKDDFCVDFYSYLTENDCAFYYQALTETQVYEFSKADMQWAMDHIPAIERLGRLMAEQAYMRVAERLRELQVDDLETRYNKLYKRAPELFQMIQQRYIATYLGVKPESFSRMKAKLFKVNN